MNKITKDEIIELYLSGKGSTTIEKELNISKPTILKVINEEGIVRKRDRCQKLDIKFDEKGYFITRECPKCKKDIKTYSKYRTIACRNYYNKIKNNTLCKPCSLKLQVGEGNPFYGKKHSKESLLKMTKSLTEKPNKFSSSSKPEKRIEKILKDEKFNVVRTYRVKEYICDIFIDELNLIIEYNGDYWHCNPIKYNPNYIHPHKKKTAFQIWVDDKKRIDKLKSYGYNLEVIWESDFVNDNSIINIIKKYVKN